MRAALTCLRVILVIALVLILGLQGLTIYSLATTEYSVVPLACTVALLCAGTVLFYAWPARRYIGVILCAAAAVAFVFIAVDLYHTFPETIQAYGSQGLTVGKTIWRHGSPVLIPLLMLPVMILENKLDLHAQIKQAKQAAQAEPYDPILEGNAGLRPEQVFPDKKAKRQIGIRIRK
ncbi:MAG: hypothetical protein IKI50_00915 [Clostridia bacterium]|nr:hypothetical protein [Clostridia bacterium]